VLCRELLAEGKTVVVLTETLADARIYRKVGFVPAGLWAECKRR
jgi:predicted GNAT family acetyltransferase